jgi:putative ABC transport system permease protein
MLQNREFMSERGAHMAYITLVVRTAGDPAALAPAVKEVVWSLDRNLPVSQVLTMDAVVAEANAQPRFQMLMMGIFAGVAMVLAAVGIYGLMSYSVARRTHEIGIRISLGAGRGEVLRMVLSQALTLALAGSAVGLVSALLLARLMTNLLFGVKPTDPATFIAVALTLAAVSVVASYLPARRAMRIDPMVALRYE